MSDVRLQSPVALNLGTPALAKTVPIPVDTTGSLLEDLPVVHTVESGKMPHNFQLQMTGSKGNRVIEISSVELGGKDGAIRIPVGDARLEYAQLCGSRDGVTLLVHLQPQVIEGVYMERDTIEIEMKHTFDYRESVVRHRLSQPATLQECLEWQVRQGAYQDSMKLFGNQNSPFNLSPHMRSFTFTMPHCDYENRRFLPGPCGDSPVRTLSPQQGPGMAFRLATCAPMRLGRSSVCDDDLVAIDRALGIGEFSPKITGGQPPHRECVEVSTIGENGFSVGRILLPAMIGAEHRVIFLATGGRIYQIGELLRTPKTGVSVGDGASSMPAALSTLTR